MTLLHRFSSWISQLHVSRWGCYLTIISLSVIESIVVIGYGCSQSVDHAPKKTLVVQQSVSRSLPE